MARINNLASALGLEEDSVYDENAEPVSDAQLVENDSEIEQTQNDIDTTVDTANNLVNDGTTLAAVTETVQDGIESGEGVSEPTAEVIQETIENILRRNGLSRNKRFRNMIDYPTNEDYNDRRGRLNAARRLKVSIESLWESIVDGLKKLWEKIKGYFTKLFTGVVNFDDGYRKKFEELTEKAKHSGGIGFSSYTSGQKKANDTLKDADLPLSVYFYSTNETTTIQEVRDVVDAYIHSAKDAITKITTEIEKYDIEEARFKGTSKVNDKDKFAFNRNPSGGVNYNGIYNNFSLPSNADLNSLLLDAVCKLNEDYIEIKNAAGETISQESKCKYVTPMRSQADLDLYIKACELGESLVTQGMGKKLNEASEGFMSRMWKTITEFFGSAKKAIEQGSDAKGYLRGNTQGSDDVSYKTEAEAYTFLANEYKNLLSRATSLYRDVAKNYYKFLNDIWIEQNKSHTKARER